MKIHEYNEMMAYLTRPGMKTGGIPQLVQPGIGRQGYSGRSAKYGFGGTKYSREIYEQAVAEYKALIDDLFKKEKLVDAPSWDAFVKEKFKVPSSAGLSEWGRTGRGMVERNVSELPIDYRANKKIELAKKLINAENLKLHGITQDSKIAGGAGGLFKGKILNDRLAAGAPSTRGEISRLVKATLDTDDIKIKKAFEYIIKNPDYKMTTSFGREINKLVKPGTDKPGRFAKRANALIKELPEYKKFNYTDPKTGKTANKLSYLGRLVGKMPPGSNTSLRYLLELAEDNRLGKAGFDDWFRLAGDRPHQWAFKEVVRNWNNTKGKGAVKLYDLSGIEIPWKGKESLKGHNVKDVLFSYTDPKNRPFAEGYKNKLYSIYEPSEKALEKINKNLPNKKVFDLRTKITQLPEWSELVEVVEGKNTLFQKEMMDPFTGKLSTYRNVGEKILLRLATTQYTTKEGYTEKAARSMLGQIDHASIGGALDKPFNELRLATGQQNMMFSALRTAANKYPELTPYVKALEMEVYKGGSIDNQIKGILQQTNELGKIVASSPGKVTLPTAMETAANKFLKNKIRDLPKKAVDYLTPLSKKAEDVYVKNPLIKQWANELNLKLNDDQKTILKKINDAPIPKRAKALLFPIVAGTAAITGADLMTGSAEAAEPGQMPQGSPGQLSEDEEGLGLGEYGAIGVGAAVAAKPAWKYALKPALRAIGSVPVSGYLAGTELSKEDPSYAIAGADLLLPELGKRIPGSGTGIMSKIGRGVLNPFQYLEKLGKYGKLGRIAAMGARIPSLMTPVGIGLQGVELVNQAIKEQKRIDEMRETDPEAYQEYLAEQEEMAQFSAAEGGRVGFDEGSKPKSPGRRAFLKGITALAALPLVGRFFKMGEVLQSAKPYLGPTIEKIKGMPEWFPQLVKKLYNEGEDVTKKMAYKDRQVVKRGTLEGGDDVDMFYDLDTGDVSINVTPKKGTYETKSGAYNKEYSLDYTKGEVIDDVDVPQTGTIDPKTGYTKKVPDDFSVAEIEGRMDQQAMDVDWEGKMTTVDEAMSDLTELEAFAKNKTTKQIHKKKGTKKKDVFPDYDPY